MAPSGSVLPGGLEQNSSLTIEDQSTARADFQGATITAGANLGDSLIIKTGQLDSEGILSEALNLSNEDYNNIQPGSLIGLYWFPGIIGSTTILPESDFEIGGLQETELDPASNGNAGMVVPPNNGTLNIFYYDKLLTGSESSLPTSRFTAIEVPPSGYQVWRDQTFSQSHIEAGEALPTADPDRDGLVNLMEYATSTPALAANTGPLRLSRDTGAALLAFDRIADPELRYRIEATQDLTLSLWPAVLLESTGSANIEETVTISQPLDAPEQFFRLRVDFITDL